MRISIQVFCLCLALALASCSGRGKETKSPPAEKESKKGQADAVDGTELTPEDAACKQFLDEFDSWSKEFVGAAGKLMENPGDQAMKKAYSEVAGKMVAWSVAWEQLQECPDHPRYSKRFEEISEYLESEIEKLQD